MISRRRDCWTLSTMSEGSSKLRIENVHETYHMNVYVRMGAEDTLSWSRLRELVDGKKPESKYRKFFYIHVCLSLYVCIIYSQSAFSSHFNHCFFRGGFPDQSTLTFVSPPSPVSLWPWSKAQEVCCFFFPPPCDYFIYVILLYCLCKLLESRFWIHCCSPLYSENIVQSWHIVCTWVSLLNEKKRSNKS